MIVLILKFEEFCYNVVKRIVTLISAEAMYYNL